jgi:hypothetical protein
MSTQCNGGFDTGHVVFGVGWSVGLKNPSGRIENFHFCINHAENTMEYIDTPEGETYWTLDHFYLMVFS